jgi:hypothetical protein
MKTLLQNDYRHILKIKSDLNKRFGDLIYQIYCYGSRVSEQRQDTDFDVVIVTSEKIDWKKEDEISDILYYYGIKHDILFDIRFFSREEFEVKYYFMPFIKEVKQTGIQL